MNENLERLDRDEEERVGRLRSAALRRPHLIISSQKRYTSRAQRARASFSLHLNVRQLGFTRAGVGEYIRRKIEGREQAAAYRADHPCVQHVKNGKPLTEHGAQLLGVPWIPNEASHA